MPDRELQFLRRHLSQITRGRGRRYPAVVRQRIQAWVAAQLEGGARWDEVSRELGIPVATLQRWTTPRPAPGVALRPVDIVDALDASTGRVARTLTIVAPSGLRIEGVTVADAIALLRGLA